MHSEILDIARVNLRRAGEESGTKALPRPGGRWENYCSHTRVLIGRFRAPEEVIHYVQLANTGFETRLTGAVLEENARSLELVCETLFPEFSKHIPSFAETPLSTAETLTTLRGRSVSMPLLWHMRVIMSVVRHCRPMTTLEIGGGYGAPGRVWMTNGLHRPETYIDVDFPESLFYAEVYLRAALPKLDIVYVHENEALTAGAGPRLVLCPIHNIDAVLSAPDLIVNTGSMQEMSDDYVAFYTEKIERSNARLFYSFNNFAQPISDRLEMMNFAAPTMGPDWSTEFKAFHPGQRSRAEMLLVRSGATPQSIRAAEAAVTGPDPSGGAAFLDLFDAVRRAQRSDLLLEAAAKAIVGMPYIPKEALWLCRSAKPKSATGRAILQMLERYAAESDIHAVQEHAVDGWVEGGAVVVDGLRYPIIDSTGGAIEAVMELEGAAEIAGWAGDLRSNRPALTIVAATDGAVVARTVPIGPRKDIEAGYGDGLRPAQFSIKVPLTKASAGAPLVRLFAISFDQKAIALAATLANTEFARFQ